MSSRPTYGSGSYASASGGGVVASVSPGSPAERAGIAPGDTLLTANGRDLTDVVAWWWESDGAAVRVSVAAAEEPSAAFGEPPEPRIVELAREPGESWGVEFTTAIFDRVRTCTNRCAFCFMAQLPAGLRPALYLRDDDYRLSFLAGNFITLTNLDDADVHRIATEHLSPLHISLHAVTPAVRERLVCAREDRALERFDELVEAGIELHVQIVLVPGENDGAELESTLGWLAAREGVASVGIVPLGYTAHQGRYSRSYTDPAAAAAVLDVIAPWAEAMRARDAVSWVYAADEFYLTAGRTVPPAEEYDGFPQYENGIGLIRAFVDEFSAAAGSRMGAVAAEPLAIVTGTMFAPLLEELLAESGLRDYLRVIAVENRFFGGNVAVTGLLAGADIISAARAADIPATLLVPDVVFNDDGLTLDDLTVEALQESLDARVRVVTSDAIGLLSAIL